MGGAIATVHGCSSPVGDPQSVITLWASDGSEMTVDDLRYDKANIEVQSGSQISGNLEFGAGKANLSGAAALAVSGSGHTLKLGALGGSTCDLEGLSLADADVTLRGGSRATLNLTGTLVGKVQDASELLYVGNPTLGEIEISADSTVGNK